MFKDWISEDLVRAAFKKFKAKKSPGPDGLKPVLLIHLPHNVVEVFAFFIQSVCGPTLHTIEMEGITHSIHPEAGKRFL